MIVEGKTYKKANPIKMVKAGVGLTPENRKTQGLILIHSILDNLCYASMNMTANGWLENKRKRDTFAQKQVAELEIKVPDVNAPCSSLSGGNQQKVVVGNWLNTSPKIMLYDEPSRGIDVSAKQQIFEIMWAAGPQRHFDHFRLHRVGRAAGSLPPHLDHAPWQDCGRGKPGHLEHQRTCTNFV